MRKMICLLLGLVAGVACFIGAGKVANAATSQPYGWGEWLLPTGTYCVETQGSAIIAGAVANWNRSDASIVGKLSCAGYARNMTLKFKGYNDPNQKACGYAWSEAGWTRQNVRGVSILTPNAPVVMVNYATNVKYGCRANTQQVTRVYNHEMGHWLGLGHDQVYDSVMNYNWKYITPTSLDIGRVNRRY